MENTPPPRSYTSQKSLVLIGLIVHSLHVGHLCLHYLQQGGRSLNNVKLIDQIFIPQNSVLEYWKLFSFKILNKVITNLNLNAKKIAHNFDNPHQNKNSRSLKPGYTSNFLLTIAVQFQQIIALLSHAQISVCCMSCAGNATSEEFQKY